MIARNAELTIGAALQSVSSVAQQVVVVDTGSTDSTAVVATRNGAEVFHYTWVNDFSAARNHALRYLRTDWILVLDADETLQVQSLINNLTAFSNPNIGGIQTQILNVLTPEGNTSHEHSYTRLFRRDLRFRFEGAIHEQIAQSIIKAGFEIAESSITIHHTGYMNSSPEKIQRNAELLYKELEHNPNDSFILYHIGLTEFAAGNLPQAKKSLLQAITSKELRQEQMEILLLRLAQIALAEDDALSVERYTNFTSQDPNKEGLKNYILAAQCMVACDFHKAHSLLIKPETQNSTLVDSTNIQRTLESLQKIISVNTNKTREHLPNDSLWTSIFTK